MGFVASVASVARFWVCFPRQQDLVNEQTTSTSSRLACFRLPSY